MLINKEKVNVLVNQEVTNNEIIPYIIETVEILVTKLVMKYFDCKTMDEFGKVVGNGLTQKDIDDLTEEVMEQMIVTLKRFRK